MGNELTLGAQWATRCLLVAGPPCQPARDQACIHAEPHDSHPPSDPEYDLQLNGSVQDTDHDGQFTWTAHAVLTFTGGETAQLVLVVNDGVEQRYTVNLLAGTATAARA